jgi:predicted homoserine dehydrogenase-like protein
MSVHSALREREAARRPIRVGMVGAGATGRAIALQLGTPVPGMRLVAIANRTLEHGERAFREAGFAAWVRAESVKGVIYDIFCKKIYKYYPLGNRKRP